ncbi:MAG: voltage-gated potassium channel [Rhodobacterales bacterium]|nr:MAG: voltage-gated potassium channel [Rhodobacterales bacterium]
MTREEICQALSGTHPRLGAAVAHASLVLIGLSAIAIALETEPTIPETIQRLLFGFEIVVLGVFALEYGLRLWAAEHRWRYALSFWGVVDLLSVLPAIALFTPQWQVVRALRLVRLLKLFRTSQALDRLVAALREVRGELFVFIVIALLMLYVSAVGIYIFEHQAQPEVFRSILSSLWWAVASFTTVGYGDMVPVTPGGRVFTTFVLFIGLGIVAVPAAIVTTALLEAETMIGRRGPSGPEGASDKTPDKNPDKTPDKTQDGEDP